MSDRPICFKKYTPLPSFSFARLFLSLESRMRARSRVVRSSDETARVSFVSYARSDAFSTSSPLPFATSPTHVVSRRVRTNLTNNKTGFKERGGDVENAPEEEGHSFFNPPRGDDDDDDDDARGGTEDEEHQSPSLPRRISLSTTRENKRAVSRRSGVSPETRLALSRMETIRRAFVLRRVRPFAFVYFYFSSNFIREGLLLKPRCIVCVCLNSICRIPV